MAKATKIPPKKKTNKKPLKKAIPAKHAGGRPTRYLPEYNERAVKLCLLGSTDKAIADFFDVAESTLNKWKLEYPEFSESLKKGKLQADANVAASLYKQSIKGNVTAAIFWLKTRQPDIWREKQIHEITGKNGKDLIPEPITIEIIDSRNKINAKDTDNESI
ncbi:MAG: hypothetical protein LBS01_01095 [Prevotellaceae bacterium]|jgi:hypothetical protein|nr:hypothetical protein [Prevotellaceae bacterium]